MLRLSSIILSALLILLASCEKLEMPQSEQTLPQQQASTPQSGGAPQPDGTNTPTNITADYCVWDLTDGEVFKTFTLSNNSMTGSPIYNVSISGYIVGYCSSNTLSNKTARFTTDNAKETNILLADNANETSFLNCVPVSLAKANRVQELTRSKLNLMTNPNNLGRKVIIWGDIRYYMGSIGVKDIYNYLFVE